MVRHENSKSLKVNFQILPQNRAIGEIDVAVEFSEVGKFFALN